MAPNKGAGAGKAASKAAKKAKQADKAAKKEAQAIKAVKGHGQGSGKGKGKVKDEEEDLEAILERYQAELRANSVASITTLETPPPPRTNALLLPSPSTLSSEPASNHLYLLFGEYFDGARATFYNSTLRYDIAKDEWREYKSGDCPAPRSSAAGVCAPGLGEGGGIVIFGGEYASPTQTTFHHYRDMWLFSIKSHTWTKLDFKKGPSGRSGHRSALAAGFKQLVKLSLGSGSAHTLSLVLWKQYIILFGGFIDVGIKTNYLSDLWIFDTEEFKWKQIEHIDPDRSPGARSGFSFLPCLEGAILHGGYRKDYVKGTRPKGVSLDDTWLLRMDPDLSKLRWEKRKRSGYLPSLRSGCSMTHWANKGMGVLFGGVFDEEKDEESMESVFYNDLFAYNPSGNGRWVSLNLKKRKKTGKRKAKKAVPQAKQDNDDDEDESMEVDDLPDEDDQDADEKATAQPVIAPDTIAVDDSDEEDDPAKTVPLTRYNAMLAIVKNTLFIYGGIFETSNPGREYTLDDFVTLNLEKLDKFVHIRGTGLDELEWRGSDDDGASSESGDDSEDDDDEDEEDADEGDEVESGEDEDESEEAKARRHAALTQSEKDIAIWAAADVKDALRQSAAHFMGVAKDSTRSEEDVLSTPLPAEVLRTFYDRSREYWAATAYAKSGSRGKSLRREGFVLAKEKYEAYRPILEEVQRIQAEAEVDAASAVKRQAGTGEARNRR